MIEWLGQWLSNIHALLVTLGAFGLVLVLARVKVPLAIAVLAGAAAIGAAFKLGPGQIALAALTGVSEPPTMGLISPQGICLLPAALSEDRRLEQGGQEGRPQAGQLLTQGVLEFNGLRSGKQARIVAVGQGIGQMLMETPGHQGVADG